SGGDDEFAPLWQPLGMVVRCRGEAAVSRVTADAKVLAVRPCQTVVVARVGVELGRSSVAVLRRGGPVYDLPALVEAGQDRRRVGREPCRRDAVLDRDLEDQVPGARD